MATKLTVTTPEGTFTRKTERTYTHVVLVKGYRAELLEARRLAGIKEAQKYIAEYSSLDAALKGFVRRTPWDVANGVTASDEASVRKSWDEGRYTEWKAKQEATLAELQAQGVITEDGNSWQGGSAEWAVLGWCGRKDLADKLASGADASRYRHVKVAPVDAGA